MAKITLNQQKFVEIEHEIPDFGGMSFLPLEQRVDYRFYRINEIGENNAFQYRMAMANVIASLGDNHGEIIYLLSGSPSGIDLYMGVAGQGQNISDEAEMLRHAFEGNFLGAQLQEIKSDNPVLQNLFRQTRHLGLITGVPSFNEEESNLDGKDYQGIERLVNTLIDARWQMVIVAEAGSDQAIAQALDGVYELSTRLSEQIKFSIQQSENEGWSETETKGTSDSKTEGKNKGTSSGTNSSKTQGTNESSSSGESGSSWNKGESKGVSDSFSEGVNKGSSEGTSTSVQIGSNQSTAHGKTGGESTAVTRERINKRNEHMQTHLNDTQVPRFMQGLSKGMYRTAIYICASNQNVYSRLSHSVLSIFQGSQPSYTPLKVHKLPVEKNGLELTDLLQLRHANAQNFLEKQSDKVALHSIPLSAEKNHINAATWLTTRELSLLAGLPALELPGLKLRKSVSFALNTVSVSEKSVNLGNVVQDGRKLENKHIQIPHDALNKHVFVTGVTGSGKTTTCMKLLLETGFPFTVIEPAKTEYRALHGQLPNAEIEYYALGREDLSTFRLNPFELVSPSQNLTGHISMLKATMCAVFPMEASMPFIVEQAIIQAYQDKGWDIANNINYLHDNPWDKSCNAWPTFSTMIGKLDGVIKSAGMGKEFEEKYKGSLVSRLTALTNGIKGTMIDTPRSIDFDKLLDKKVVIELEELKDEEDKAFFMGLIIARFAECMKQRHRQNPAFKHITLVEEAHRLLSQPEPGADGSKKLGVEMFANLLAEVRKYGECLVIADQIPNKLVADVIKNTNTKIIHRLFAADDRKTIGDAMGLQEEQKDFLPMLQAGETVVYSGGWHAAVRAQIHQLANTTAAEISEELIKKQGRKQLWQQRHALLPRLSRHAFLNEENFYSVFQAARSQLNLLIALALRHPDKNQGVTTQYDALPLALTKIAKRLRAQFARNQAEFGLPVDVWATVLRDLFCDVACTDEMLNLEDEQFQSGFAAMFVKLQASVPEFFGCLASGLPKILFFKILSLRNTI